MTKKISEVLPSCIPGQQIPESADGNNTPNNSFWVRESDGALMWKNNVGTSGVVTVV